MKRIGYMNGMNEIIFMQTDVDLIRVSKHTRFVIYWNVLSQNFVSDFFSCFFSLLIIIYPEEVKIVGVSFTNFNNF